MTFRRQRGHVRRARGWWTIECLQFSIDDQNKLVRKRVIAKLAPAMIHGSLGLHVVAPSFEVLHTKRTEGGDSRDGADQLNVG